MSKVEKGLSLFFVPTVARAASAFLVFLNSAVVASKIGAEESGVFFFSLAIVTVLSVIFRFGFDNSVLRDFGAASKDNLDIEINKLFSVCTIVSFFSVSIILLFYTSAGVFGSPGFLDRFVYTLLYLSPATLLISLNALIAISYQGEGSSILSVFYNGLLINIIFLFALLIFSPSNSILVALFYTSACFLNTVLLFLKRFRFRHFNFSIKIIRLIKDSINFWNISICSQMVTWSGQIIAGFFVTATELGLYSIALRYSMAVTFILTAINLVIAPSFAKLRGASSSLELRNLTKFSSGLATIGTLPFIIPMIFFPELILGYLGKEYVEASSLLRVLAIGQLINASTGSVGYLLLMTGRDKVMRNIVWFSAAVTISVTILLTIRYGVLGCAFATAFGVAIQNVLAFVVVRLELAKIDLIGKR